MNNCSKCKKPLMQKSNNKIKIRTNIVVFEKSNDDSFDKSIAVIKCPHCHADNQIAILLDTSSEDIKHLIL